MAKVRPYYLKVVGLVEGERKALVRAEEWKAMGLSPTVFPGIDPKCGANHDQPGFGGKIDQICPECGGYNYV